MSGRGASDGLIPLSPEEWAKRQPPRPWELMGASWEPIATPERKLARWRPILLLPRPKPEPRQASLSAGEAA